MQLVQVHSRPASLVEVHTPKLNTCGVMNINFISVAPMGSKVGEAKTAKLCDYR